MVGVGVGDTGTGEFPRERANINNSVDSNVELVVQSAVQLVV